jgi:hypothetical protein
MLEYGKFARQATLTRFFDPSHLSGSGSVDGASDPYLAKFDDSLTLQAQMKNISKEEAFSDSLKELVQDFNTPAYQRELRANLESVLSQKA